MAEKNDINSFLVFFDQKEFFERLSPPECKKLILSIFDYCIHGEEPDLDPLTDMAFLAFKGSLDRNRLKRNRIREHRIEAGKKSAAARAKQNEQVSTKDILLNNEKGVEQKKPCSTKRPSVSVSVSGSVSDTPKPPKGDFARSGKSASRLSLSEKKKVRVEENTDLMIRIGGWKKFGRRPGTAWTVYEAESLDMLFGSRELAGLNEEQAVEVAVVERHYNADLPDNGDYRRNAVTTLLNNWTDAVDRARRFAGGHTQGDDAPRGTGIREYSGLEGG